MRLAFLAIPLAACASRAAQPTTAAVTNQPAPAPAAPAEDGREALARSLLASQPPSEALTHAAPTTVDADTAERVAAVTTDLAPVLARVAVVTDVAPLNAIAEQPSALMLHSFTTADGVVGTIATFDLLPHRVAILFVGSDAGPRPRLATVFEPDAYESTLELSYDAAQLCIRHIRAVSPYESALTCTAR